MSESVYDINKKLILEYGRDVVNDLPKLRIVWSSNQYETRVNEAGFDIYSSEGLFLRTEFGPHEVEKYPLSPDMWVLEVMVPNTAGDILGVSYTYEPLWVFGAANSCRDPIYRACKLLVDAKLQILRQDGVKIKSEADARSVEDEKKKKETILFKDMLKDDSEPLVNAMVSGSAISVPSTYNEKDKDNVSI